MIHPPKMIAFVTALAIALSTRNAITLSNPAPREAQPSSQIMAGLPPPPDTGTPDGQRTPGGTRPELTVACKQTEQPLTALIPKNGRGLTTAEYPLFWFYIPYAPKDVHSIEFSVHNRDETTTLYRTSLQLTKAPGVIGVPLPPSAENALKLNQSYHWYLIVNCQPTETFENHLVLDGWVTRVQQSPDFDVIWYDELTSLAKRYLSEPQNTKVKNAWAELLRSVGLEGLTQAPLINSASKDAGRQSKNSQ
jgi:hypothetical protein